MTRRNTIKLASPAALLALTEADGAVVVEATQLKPGRFNEHVTARLSMADAVRVYLWLGEVLGREGQP